MVLVASAVAAAAGGAVVGVAAARLRGPYLAGATLMLAVALPSLALRFGLLGGDQGLTVVVTSPGFLGPAFPVTRWQAWLTCGCALIVLVLLANLARSRVGRSWRAAGDDEVAAALAGLNVARLRVLAFVVSAACAGLAGALLAVTTSIISPDAFTLTLSIALLTGAVLGGLGTLPGAVWGSLVLVLVPTYVTDTASSHGLSSSAGSNIPVAAYGVVLIVVMLAFPNGIQGGLRRLGRPLAARLPAARPPLAARPSSPASCPSQRTPGRRLDMNRSHRAGLPALAAVAALALVVSACSSGSGGSGSKSGALTASAPGITATTITIGSHQPLTGVAAPGYDEIAPASNAYFQYVNAHGGIYGRKIVYKYLDDKYDPTNTVSVVKQLVLQDNVYAIFDGLGTPTHLAVAPFLNSSKVPDVFVASGCECWNAPSTLPETFGWQLDYVREGKILGTYIKQHFAGQKIGYFYQDDEFGKDGVKGLDDEIPHADVVSRQSYDPTNINVGPQVAALKASGAKVVVSFSVPAFTALLKLNSLKLGFNPTFVVSDVGSDPITLAGLLEAYAKQGGATVSGNQLTQGIITDGYLPTLGDTSNSWVALFKKIHDKYLPKLPFDGNVAFGEAVALHLRPGHAQGGQEPDPGRPGQGDPGRAAARAGGGALRLLRLRSRRDDGGLHRHHQERRHRQGGSGPGHGHVPDRAR